MKIVLIGQSAFGAETLKRIKFQNKIIGVFAPYQNNSCLKDPIEETAEELQVKTFTFPKLRSDKAIKSFKNLNPDLCVMAYVTEIVPDEIISSPKFGTIQFHPSLLPKHRGPSSINWPIINGEKRTGISIFYPDKGLDTGPILIQKKIAIDQNDSVGSLYFKKLFPLGIDAIVEAINQIKLGNSKPKIQDEKMATYEGWCNEKHTKINWESNVEIIHNLIRGSDPQPGAHTIYNTKQIFIYGSKKIITNQTKKFGSVSSIEKEGIRIACKEGEILFEKVREKNEKKISAFEWSKISNLKIGDIFLNE